MPDPIPNNSLCFSVDAGLTPARRLTALSIEGVNVASGRDTAPNIRTLTEGMERGDEGAYRQFYSLYFDRLLRYLLVLTRDEESAREALQLTLVRVVKHARRFDSEEPLWSWLTVLARSAAIDEQRKKQRYSSFLSRFFQQKQIEEQTVEVNSHDLMDVLEAQFAVLEPEERDLLRRKYLEGESVRDMAEANATTEKAIESRLVRVRRRLKEMIFSQLTHGR